METLTATDSRQIQPAAALSTPELRWFLAVIVLGFVLRFIACLQTPIINNDGALYIYQAKAIFRGDWKDTTMCSLTYLSIYPLLIAGAFGVVGDWVTAARTVSLLCGTAMLWPLHMLLRRFVEWRYALLTVLMVAVLPLLVGRSADVIKGPVCWLLVAAGLNTFYSGLSRDRFPLLLSVSCLLQLLAVWARIEAVLFIPVSILSILVWGGRRRGGSLLWFIAPLIVFTLAVMAGMTVKGVDVDFFYRIGDIRYYFMTPITGYQALQHQLAVLMTQTGEMPVRLFLPEAQNTVWLVALGTILNRALEAYFYPFVPVYVIGLLSFFRARKRDGFSWSLLLSTITMLAMLYVFMISFWVMEYRFMVVAILPSLVFAAYGFRALDGWATRRFSLKPGWGFRTMVVLVLICGLPKSLAPRDPDKIVFRQIGAAISVNEGKNESVSVSTSPETHRWISFYANENVPHPPCPEADKEGQWARYADDPAKFLEDLKARGIRYYLWEEKRWPADTGALARLVTEGRLAVLGQWRHRDTGDMTLYVVR